MDKKHLDYIAKADKRPWMFGEPKFWRMVINLCLCIYIAQAEDEEFSVVDAV